MTSRTRSRRPSRRLRVTESRPECAASAARPPRTPWSPRRGSPRSGPATTCSTTRRRSRSVSSALERCALSVLATVTSRPAPDRLILDSGSKALAAERLSTLTPGFGDDRGPSRSCGSSGSTRSRRSCTPMSRATSPSAPACASSPITPAPPRTCTREMLVVEGEESSSTSWPIGDSGSGDRARGREEDRHGAPDRSPAASTTGGTTRSSRRCGSPRATSCTTTC